MQLALPNDLRVGDVAQPKRVLGEYQNEEAEATIKLAHRPGSSSSTGSESSRCRLRSRGDSMFSAPEPFRLPDDNH